MRRTTNIFLLAILSLPLFGQIDLINNNIGIGLLEPQVPIHMVGDTFQIQNEAGDNHFFMNAVGNIGIGRNPGGNKLDVEGAIVARGRFLYLGNSSLSTNNGGAKFTMRSFHSNKSQLLLADKENAAYGSLFGTTDGRYFGLLDSDNQWSFLIDKDNHIQMRINNIQHYYQNGNVTALRPSELIIGWGQSGNRPAFIDLIGDDTYNDYGFRIIRNNTGPNTSTQLIHRGTSGFEFVAPDAGRVLIKTDNLHRFMVRESGNVGIGTTNPSYELHVVGDIAYTGNVFRTSDKRLKQDINGFKYGIKEIVQLNPVSYKYKSSASLSDNYAVSLIAQDLKKIAPDLVQSSPLTVNTDLDATEEKNLDSYLSINESALIYILINAAKEQQVQIDKQQQQIEELQESLTFQDISQQINNRIDLVLENSAHNQIPFLSQNVPNPTDNNTLIKYFIPESSFTSIIRFYNLNGQVLKEIELDSGQGELDIDLNGMITGSYMYSLIIDGKLADTKTMIITR